MRFKLLSSKLIVIIMLVCSISCNRGNTSNSLLKEKVPHLEDTDNQINTDKNSCNNLPETFSSYDQAIKAVETASFSFTDELPSDKS